LFAEFALKPPLPSLELFVKAENQKVPAAIKSGQLYCSTTPPTVLPEACENTSAFNNLCIHK